MSFQIGVSTTAASANAALDENNAKMAALEATLLKNGITKKNLQTSGLNIYENTNTNGTIISFTAQDNLNVTTHDLAKVGTRHRRRGQGRRQRHPVEWHDVLDLQPVEVSRRGAGARHP